MSILPIPGPIQRHAILTFCHHNGTNHLWKQVELMPWGRWRWTEVAELLPALLHLLQHLRAGGPEADAGGIEGHDDRSLEGRLSRGGGGGHGPAAAAPRARHPAGRA